MFSFFDCICSFLGSKIESRLTCTDDYATCGFIIKGIRDLSICRPSPQGRTCFLRKEVIQPHLPIRLPCYDFTPVINPTFDSCLLAVGSLASGIANSHGVTGGVYKTRERIHRDILIRDY